MGEVFRISVKPMIKRHSKKEFFIKEKQNTTERRHHPKGSCAFPTLRGSDAPAPASSPPPAAPANSVNISDGLAPAREAGGQE